MVRCKFLLKCYGVIISVGNGNVSLLGCTGAVVGEVLVVCGSGSQLLVVNLRKDLRGRQLISAVLVNPDEIVFEGSEVFRSGLLASIKLGDSLLGAIIDPLGSPITQSSGSVSLAHRWQIENPAPGIISRQSVNQVVDIKQSYLCGSTTTVLFYAPGHLPASSLCGRVSCGASIRDMWGSVKNRTGRNRSNWSTACYDKSWVQSKHYFEDSLAIISIPLFIQKFFCVVQVGSDNSNCILVLKHLPSRYLGGFVYTLATKLAYKTNQVIPHLGRFNITSAQASGDHWNSILGGRGGNDLLGLDPHRSDPRSSALPPSLIQAYYDFSSFILDLVKHAVFLRHPTLAVSRARAGVVRYSRRDPSAMSIELFNETHANFVSDYNPETQPVHEVIILLYRNNSLILKPSVKRDGSPYPYGIIPSPTWSPGWYFSTEAQQ